MSESGVRPLSPQEIAQQLNDWFLSGKGSVTQTPGAAAPSVRKYYSTHKGYDLAVPQGTLINTEGLENLGATYDNTGYGQRIALYDPNKNQTYYLSHLSKIVPGENGALQVYSGGLPGSYGSGNTTGAHVDIEFTQGKIPFSQMISRPTSAQVAQSYQDPQALLRQVRSQYGNNVIGISSDRARLEELAKQRGGRVVKIKV